MRRTIHKRLRRSGGGIDLAAAVDAAVVVNRNASGTSSESRSRSEIRVEQGAGTGSGAVRGEPKHPNQEAR